MGTDAQTVEKHMACIVELGATDGFEMNWKKVELMTARCDLDLKNPSGEIICKNMEWRFDL